MDIFPDRGRMIIVSHGVGMIMRKVVDQSKAWSLLMIQGSWEHSDQEPCW